MMFVQQYILLNHQNVSLFVLTSMNQLTMGIVKSKKPSNHFKYSLVELTEFLLLNQ